MSGPGGPRVRQEGDSALLLFSRLFLPALIELDRGPHERLQRALVDLVAFEKIDGATLIALKAGVEELVGVGQVRTLVEGDLHLALVGVGDRNDAVARPDGAAHPLPFLDDLLIGGENGLADA